MAASSKRYGPWRGGSSAELVRSSSTQASRPFEFRKRTRLPGIDGCTKVEPAALRPWISSTGRAPCAGVSAGIALLFPLAIRYITKDVLEGGLSDALPRITRTGALGHPEKGTTEKGKRIFEAAIKATETFLREFATWPWPKDSLPGVE